MADQNSQLEEIELEEGLAPAPPKVQRSNSDASVLIVERDLVYVVKFGTIILMDKIKLAEYTP